jgi:menaquinone-specific isochorismate synthase
MPYISKLEHFDRGWYAAPIGWINANGEGEFVVAIRSGLIKSNEVRFFAGCGIVEDSNPQKEWDETNLKFIPMLTALEHARK